MASAVPSVSVTAEREEKTSRGDDKNLLPSCQEETCIPQAQTTASRRKGGSKPDHFLAIRVTDNNIRKRVQVVQDFIVSQQPHFSQYRTPLATLHVTLCVLQLNTPELLAAGSRLLVDLEDDLRHRCPRRPFMLRRFYHFSDGLVCVKLMDNGPVDDFVEYIMSCVTKAGLRITDKRKPKLHMTIFKVPSDVTKTEGKVDPAVYERYSNTEFGSQTIGGILLCSMGDGRREDGFYLSPAEIRF